MLLLLVLWGFAAHGDDLLLDAVVSARPFLRWQRAPYHNFHRARQFPRKILHMQTIAGEFTRNGYCVVRGLFAGSELDEMEAEFDRIAAQIQATEELTDGTWRGANVEKLKSKDDQVLHTHNVHRYSAVWLQAIQNPHFLDAVGEILGPDIVLNHTKLFLKPPEKGSPFPMHQDWSYFPTVKDSMMAAIIHLTEATDEMGCVRVYPRSHELGRVLGTGGQTDTAQETLQKYPIEGATVLEAERGDVVFFSYLTLHGSMPNRSNKSRKTVLVQMYSGDDRMEEGVTHPDERLTLRGWNHHMTRNRATRNNTIAS